MKVELCVWIDDLKLAEECFSRFNLKYKLLEVPDDYPSNIVELEGTRESLFNYVTSECYEMDIEDVEEFYPELLSPKNTNLGFIIGKFAKNEADEIIMHYDVSAWSAPSECHDDVRRGAEKAFLDLEKELGMSFEELQETVKEKGFNFHRIYENCLTRILKRDNPFI